ncbi:MAG TPA: hemolysin family protein [Bacteroidota bacterium]|nr:hemolysin family protein [Bacteroidota bacterium]
MVELFGILVLIMLNGMFALSEIAIVSSRKARLQYLANKGNQKARAALELSANPENFLSTVQAGITLVGIMAGALGGITISESLKAWLQTFPLLAPYAEWISLGMVVVPITYLSIIIGELIPKQLALRDPERTAMLIAIPMRTLSTIMYPIVWFLSASTSVVIRSFGITKKVVSTITQEEIKVMIDEGTKAGTFDLVEKELVERIFRLGDKHVSSLMTSRTEIVWVDVESPAGENMRRMTESSHSIFPVCRGSAETILGIVHIKDLYASAVSGQAFSLERRLRQALYVVETLPAVALIGQFKQTGIHFAFVVDEYGGIQGLVTLNDILKAVVGEGMDDDATKSSGITERTDGSYLIDGSLTLDEFVEYFHLDRMMEEDAGNYHTVAGFVIKQMGAIPRVGQAFEWRSWRIEVVDLDGKRVDKLLMSRIGEPELP